MLEPTVGGVILNTGSPVILFAITNPESVGTIFAEFAKTVTGIEAWDLGLVPIALWALTLN